MINYDTLGRLVAQSYFSEMEKIAADAMGADPQAGMLSGGVQNEAPAAPNTEVVQNEASPAHGVIASRIRQLDPRRAVGIPVLQPPPGYIYNPELASFVPNEQDPGWMEQQKVLAAAGNKGWFDAGQQKVVADQAQQQLDTQADADMQQAAAAGEQEQQQAQMQQAAQQEAMMSEAKASGKNRADAASGVTPKAAAKPAAKRSSAGKKPEAKKEEGAKGVTIHVGK